MEPRIEFQSLRCEFTDEELKAFSKELAHAILLFVQVEGQKQAELAQFSERMTQQKIALSALARKINKGYEMRYVDCIVNLDSPTRGSAQLVRLDTGEEVSIRPMSQQELQAVLDFETADVTPKSA